MVRSKIPKAILDEQVADDGPVERWRRWFASGFALAVVSHSAVVVYEARSQLTAKLVNAPQQDPAVVRPQVFDVLWVLDPRHGKICLLQRVFRQPEISCPRPGKVLYLGIFPDRRQLLKE